MLAYESFCQSTCRTESVAGSGNLGHRSTGVAVQMMLPRRFLASPARARMLFLLALATSAIDALSAQSIAVNAGSASSSVVLPGARLTVPRVIDLANAGATNIASHRRASDKLMRKRYREAWLQSGAVCGTPLRPHEYWAQSRLRSPIAHLAELVIAPTVRSAAGSDSACVGTAGAHAGKGVSARDGSGRQALGNASITQFAVAAKDPTVACG